MGSKTLDLQKAGRRVEDREDLEVEHSKALLIFGNMDLFI